jgi:hypothetical protein
MYNTRMAEWVEVARQLCEEELSFNDIDGSAISIQAYDVDPTSKDCSIDIDGVIDYDTVCDEPEMDYFNGTGYAGGLRITAANFCGELLVTDENEDVIYCETVKIKIL